MAQNVVVCDIEPGLKEKLKKFRLRKETNNAAIIMKIDKEKMQVIVDDELEDISPEELAEELPPLQPRYVVYSYKFDHDDGRTSYPLCFIFISPQGAKPEMMMMYAGSKTNLVHAAELTKVFELRSTEELTEEWLIGKLNFFR